MSISTAGEPIRRVGADQARYGAEGRSPWLDVDWHEHQRWVELDGRPVNVIELGAANTRSQPLLFVHGLSGCWQNWLEQLPVLAGKHRVIALDLPGFGQSPPPHEPISIAGYARLLDHLLGELSIAAAAVVGNSMGGFIAAELAIASPQRVERLVLVSAAGISTHGDRRTGYALPALRRAERRLAVTGTWLGGRAESVISRPRLRRAALGLVARHPERLGAALSAEQLRGAGKPGFMAALQSIHDYEIRERLARVVCPTLIVWGTSDLLVTVRDAEVFTELIPDSRAVVYEDTGHVAMLERPGSFNELLAEFLSE